MNNIDKQYTDLLQDILDNGITKQDRTGTGTVSVFGRQIRHDMKTGFPLLTTKKMAFKTIVTELIWFLRGNTNIKYLVDNNCHIWDGDCFANYYRNFEKHLNTLPEDSETEFIINKDKFINKIKTDDEFAKKWGDLGPIYGKQWRKWESDDTDAPRYEHWKKDIDQIAKLIYDLKTNPDSRRLMVSAWNVGELDQMVLPPCHYGFQVYTRELSEQEKWEQYTKSGLNVEINGTPLELKHMGTPFYPKSLPQRAISLMWNQRSVDTFLGLPFNIASYGLLLEIIAKMVNMIPDELIGNLGDVHLYSNHIEQAKEQIGRKYTSEERHEMLKTAMGDFYKTAVDEQVPFGGGLSEYYDSYKIPNHTREPFELPTLKINSGNENWHLLTVDEVINTLDVDITFKPENYQSHPSIKAPLSN
jgi:thymidylate synthase